MDLGKGWEPGLQNYSVYVAGQNEIQVKMILT